MKILLSNQCLSLTGMLNTQCGYHLEHRKSGFFAKRNQKGFVPPDGHWRFILTCAQLAQTGLYISDIIVPPDELRDALDEAGYTHVIIFPATYYAESILELKSLWNL